MSLKHGLILGFSILLFAAGTEVSMGMFDFLKVCLFSEVNGQVTKDGKPVAGAEVMRSVELNDKTYTDTTLTNAEGRYHFAERQVKSMNSILPVEPFIPQLINIKYNKQQFIGWKMNKRNYDVNGEIDKALQLSCELNDEPNVKEQRIGPNVFGICKWNLDFSVKEISHESSHPL
jgi:hypothetical protein